MTLALIISIVGLLAFAAIGYAAAGRSGSLVTFAIVGIIVSNVFVIVSLGPVVEKWDSNTTTLRCDTND